MRPAWGSIISKSLSAKKIDGATAVSKQVIVSVLLGLASLAVCACGSGGVETASSGGTGGTGVTALSVGSITSFGSIEVNGTHYDTGGAELFVEGQRAGIGDQVMLARLAAGMIVRVEGTRDGAENGAALRVYFNDDLRGPIDTIQEVDAQTLELSVLGKTVIVDGATKTDDDFDLASLQPDDWIQVSGYQDPEGRLRASFATVTDDDAEANLKGVVTQLDTVRKIFTINGVEVDYENANVVELDWLGEGVDAEVTGELLSSNRLIARRIDPVNVLGVEGIDDVELEGIVSNIVSDAEIHLDSVVVRLDDQTEFIGGNLEDLAAGRLVEVEGSLIEGVVYADRLRFAENAKVESKLAAIDPVSSTLTLAGLEDISIAYNALTRVTGEADRIDDLTGPVHLKIIGCKTASHQILAYHVIALPDPLNKLNKVKLIGRLDEAPIGPSISIFGHTIDMSAIDDENFESPEGVGVGYGVFFDLLSPGVMVTATGLLGDADEVQWTGIAIE